MKKTIFTCLFGDYDNLLNAPNFKDWDTVLFTDKEPIDSKGWQVRIVKKELSDQKESRRYKFLSHIYLKEYDLVCYIDANMELRREPPSVSFWQRHPRRRDVFQEAKRIIELKKEDHFQVSKQIDYYKSKGYTGGYNFPLCENGFFVRNHNSKMNIFCEMVFKIVQKFTYRDQLSLPYVCWVLKHSPEGFTNRNFSYYYYRLNNHLHETRTPHNPCEIR